MVYDEMSLSSFAPSVRAARRLIGWSKVLD
jgi:hypothetical protein